MGQPLVLFFCVAGQQNPNGVDAERGSEGDIEQREEAGDERQNAGPGSALQQSASGSKATRNDSTPVAAPIPITRAVASV